MALSMDALTVGRKVRVEVESRLDMTPRMLAGSKGGELSCIDCAMDD